MRPAAGSRELGEIESYYFVETDRGHIERDHAILLAMRSVRARDQ